MVKKVGNLSLLCNGKIFVGPDWKSLTITFFLVLIPSILFLALIACDIGTDIFWLSVLLVLFVMVMLCLTAFSNPGIIPRESVPNNASLDPAFLRLPRTKDFQINGYRVTTKYCTTCHIYRLPRCSHCAMCDNCVEKFDHYCPWVGTCIGRRNYRYFLLFVLSATVLSVYVFSASLARLVELSERHHHSFQTAIKKEPIAIVLIVYTFVATWFVGGLTVFHMYLVATNQTTYEHFRRRFGRKGNPYHKSFPRNVFEALCQLHPPYGWVEDSATLDLRTSTTCESELPASFLTDATLASVEKMNDAPEKPPSHTAPSSHASSQTGPCGFMPTGLSSPCRQHSGREVPADVGSVDYQDSIYTTASSILEEQLQARLPAMTTQSVQSTPSSFVMDVESMNSSLQARDGSSPKANKGAGPSGAMACDSAREVGSPSEQANDDEDSSVCSTIAQASARHVASGAADVGHNSEGVVDGGTSDDGEGRLGAHSQRGPLWKPESKFRLGQLIPRVRSHHGELKKTPSLFMDGGHHRQAPKPPSFSEPIRGAAPVSSVGESSARSPNSPKPMRGIEGMMAGLNRQRYSELVEVQGPQASAVSESKSSDSAPSASRSSTDTAPSSMFSPSKFIRSLGRSGSSQLVRLSGEMGHYRHHRTDSQDATASFTQDMDDREEEQIADFKLQTDGGLEEIGTRPLFSRSRQRSYGGSDDPSGGSIASL